MAETNTSTTSANTSTTSTGDVVERKWLAHYIDASFNGTTAKYIRLGEDLEEYSIEMNADTDTKKNILGENSVRVKGYEPQGTVDTYYAYQGDALYTQLESIINERLTGSKLRTTVVDVLVDSTGAVKWAYKEDVVVVPQSYGGDTAGVNIPFEIHYCGNRTMGTFNTSTKTFTASTT